MSGVIQRLTTHQILKRSDAIYWMYIYFGVILQLILSHKRRNSRSLLLVSHTTSTFKGNKKSWAWIALLIFWCVKDIAICIRRSAAWKKGIYYTRIFRSSGYNFFCFSLCIKQYYIQVFQEINWLENKTRMTYLHCIIIYRIWMIDKSI